MHDFEEPTEPMSQVFLPLYSAPTFQTGISIERYAIPTPELDEVPFPKSGGNPVDVSGFFAIPLAFRECEDTAYQWNRVLLSFAYCLCYFCLWISLTNSSAFL